MTSNSRIKLVVLAINQVFTTMNNTTGSIISSNPIHSNLIHPSPMNNTTGSIISSNPIYSNPVYPSQIHNNRKLRNFNIPQELCENNVLKSNMKDAYSVFPFSYKNITTSIKNMLDTNLPSQKFFIFHDSIPRIFQDQETAFRFLNISRNIKLIIKEALDFLKNSTSSVIRGFTSEYLIKRFTDFPHLIGKRYDIDDIISRMMTGEFCPEMTAQLYVIIVLDYMISILDLEEGYPKNEMNFMFLKDLISILDFLRHIKTNMTRKEIIEEFNQMFVKRCEIFEEMVHSMVIKNIFETETEWYKIMNLHFDYEARLMSLQRSFRSKLEIGMKQQQERGDGGDPKKHHDLSSINVVIDTSPIHNEIIISDIKSMENSYFQNKIKFIEENQKIILQNVDERISFKKSYSENDYTLNLIPFNINDQNNNDIFLYKIRSEYVLNVYKVFTSFKFKLNYNGEIDCFTVWTLTDKYESRLNSDLIKSENDIIKIVMSILKGLRDIENENVFLSHILFEDIVIYKRENLHMRENLHKRKNLHIGKDSYKIGDSSIDFKIDLKRAFKSHENHHNKMVDGFISFFNQIFKKSKISKSKFENFIKFLDEKPSFDEILSKFEEIK